MRYFAVPFLMVMLAACAKVHRSFPEARGPSAAARSGVLGAWDAEASGSSANEKESLVVFEDHVVGRKVCRGWGRAVHVEVVAPARVTGSHVEVTSPARGTGGPDQIRCEMQIDAGRVAYQVEGDTLIFTPIVGGSYVYGHRSIDPTAAARRWWRRLVGNGDPEITPLI